MPAAPRAAPAPAPTSSSFRVSFMALRRDGDEPAHDAVEVAMYLLEGERLRDVLADRVQVSVRFPCVEDVPLVDPAVHRVERGRDRAEATLAARVAEARRVRLVRLAGDDLDVLAARDLRPAREAPEIDVDVLARRLVPEEADEVALVLLDGDAVVPLAADLAVQRVRHPRGAVDRDAHAAGQPVPGGPPALRAGRRLRLRGRGGLAVVARASGADERQRDQSPCSRQSQHSNVIAGKSRAMDR